MFQNLPVLCVPPRAPIREPTLSSPCSAQPCLMMTFGDFLVMTFLEVVASWPGAPRKEVILRKENSLTDVRPLLPCCGKPAVCYEVGVLGPYFLTYQDPDLRLLGGPVTVQRRSRSGKQCMWSGWRERMSSGLRTPLRKRGSTNG